MKGNRREGEGVEMKNQNLMRLDEERFAIMTSS